jgi:DNA-binding GntR family transcriptional regulator
MPRTKPRRSRGPASRAPRFLTLSEQLAERIGEEILNERYPPGHRMKEVDLAEAFRVSRASIREALRLLAVRGLVQIESRRGARVTQLSADEVDDLYEIRESLLAVAAARAARRAAADDVDRARALLERVQQHKSDATQARYFDAVYALSDFIAEAAASPRLAMLIRSFSQQVARYTRLSLQSEARRRRSAERWRRLVDAIEAHDPDTAERVMRELVRGSKSATRDILSAAVEQEAA